jgi:CO/xanthine dehydrogenase Mo-binding subunit
METVGKSFTRVDARGKVTGEAKYTNDLMPKDALWAQMSQSTQSRILAWINGHPGRVSATTLDEAFGAGTVERQYMALVYGV